MYGIQKDEQKYKFCPRGIGCVPVEWPSNSTGQAFHVVNIPRGKHSRGQADLALASSLEHNRSLKLMKNLNASIDWSSIEAILMNNYTAGTSTEGDKAYPPLLLFKCLLLQKWFRPREIGFAFHRAGINSDPELENQINDRLSFKKFLNLSFSKPSPDHSTFSRFRNRLSKNAIDQINSEIPRQFEKQGLTINEGVAIDARLVKSANHPISNEQIKEFKEKMNTPKGKLDKNGKPIKYTRDIDSDWVVKNDKPHYGLKEHAFVDVNHGFILATTLIPSSVNDTNLLQYCTAFSRHTKQSIEKVYADKGYAGLPNRKFLAENKIADGIMRKNSTTATLTEYEIERNKKISKFQYIVEQYFGISHLQDRANRARFTAIAKNKVDCWYRQAAYNVSRGLKLLKVATL